MKWRSRADKQGATINKHPVVSKERPMNSVKIDAKNNLEAVKAQPKAKAEQSSDAATPPIEQTSAPATDKLSVSARANTINELVARANELPEIRQERVAALRERIQSGDYRPDAGDIADAILKDEQP